MSIVSRAMILLGALALLAFSNARAAADQAASHENSSATEPQEVVVTAQRAKLSNRVQKFVDQIVVPENEGVDGIARWGAPPVCPLVSGLTRQEGEFILERLSQIGREIDAPLAGAHCRPNLYVLFTMQPEELLRLMEKRNRPFTFGYDDSYYPHIETPESIVDEFIRTPSTVRVWYNSKETDPWGQPLRYCKISGHGAQTFARCGPSESERATLSAMTTFSRVFVVADKTRLRGVKLGQLADYIAMVGFAKLKPGARLGDSPTILKLFNGSAQAAPASMTNWDHAFLKSLYATDRTSKSQQYWISRRMVQDILH